MSIFSNCILLVIAAISMAITVAETFPIMGQQPSILVAQEENSLIETGGFSNANPQFSVGHQRNILIARNVQHEPEAGEFITVYSLEMGTDHGADIEEEPTLEETGEDGTKDDSECDDDQVDNAQAQSYNSVEYIPFDDHDYDILDETPVDEVDSKFDFRDGDIYLTPGCDISGASILQTSPVAIAVFLMGIAFL